MTDNPDSFESFLNQFEAKKTEFDNFPVNLLEQDGTIKRNGFRFDYSEFLVYEDGQCVFSTEEKNTIMAETHFTGVLKVAFDDENVSDFSVRTFAFTQISTNVDRIIWSKDLLNQDNSVIKGKHVPDVMSLFYKDGILSRVSIVIHDPNILLEFNL